MHLLNILSAYALHSTRHYLPRSFASGRGRRISSSILFCNGLFPPSPPLLPRESMRQLQRGGRGRLPANSSLSLILPSSLSITPAVPARRRRGCYEAMMKGEMDYSRESAGNDITFLRDGFHFFLYPMALSHSRVCFDKLETPIRLLLGLNFIGVLSPQVSPASRRRVAHGGFVARGLRLAWHSAERSPQKSPSSSVSEGGNCLWRKTCCLPWDLSTIRLWRPREGHS